MNAEREKKNKILLYTATGTAYIYEVTGTAYIYEVTVASL